MKLTPEEVADQTDITAERVRQMARVGFIDGEKKSGVWLLPRSVIVKIQNRNNIERRGRRAKRSSAKNNECDK